jgi:hypothetical protein
VKQTNAIERGKKEFLVKLFVNEKEVNIPSCDDFPCYYDVAKRKYNDYINKCNIKEICGIRPDDNVDSQGNTANIISAYSITGQLLTILLFMLPFI